MITKLPKIVDKGLFILETAFILKMEGRKL